MRLIEAPGPQTMKGLTAKIRAVARDKDDDPFWQAIVADVERVAATIDWPVAAVRPRGC